MPVDARTGESSEWHPIESVEGIQERLGILRRLGGEGVFYDGPANGRETERLVEAIRDFQSEHDLTADGIPGPRTRTALEKALSEAVVIWRTPDTPNARAIDAADPTAARLGCLIGARKLVQGTFAPAGGTKIQLGASVVEVSDASRSTVGAPISGPLSRVIYLEKELVYQILEFLGVEPTPAERREIDKIPTDDYLALLAFGRGLALENQGRSQEAMLACSQSVQMDSRFIQAAARAEQVSASQLDGSAIDQLSEAAKVAATEEFPVPREGR